jgi:hypothetical protein
MTFQNYVIHKLQDFHNFVLKTFVTFLVVDIKSIQIFILFDIILLFYINIISFWEVDNYFFGFDPQIMQKDFVEFEKESIYSRN